MLYLHGLGHFHPENVIDNKFLEDLDIGTSDEWIMERVGIKTRRTVLPLDYLRETKNQDPRETDRVRLYSDAEMGARAAKMAMERAGIKPEDIGLIIAGSSLPQYVSPPQASALACELGIEVLGFDMHASCSTFGMHLNFLNRMKPSSLPPYVLVVSVETPTISVNFADRSAAVLFGDGSSAAVVSATVPSNKIVIDYGADSRPSQWKKVFVPRWSFFEQDGHAVQGFAIRKTTEGIKKVMEHMPPEAKRGIFVGHQANLAVLRTACERTGITDENHWHNVTWYGNTGSVGAPSVVSQRWEELAAGDYIAMCIVGAGLTWAQLAIYVK